MRFQMLRANCHRRCGLVKRSLSKSLICWPTALGVASRDRRGSRRSSGCRMLHYHGTPITPNAELLALAGRCFCVSHARPDQVELVHQIGSSVLLDNGAFTKHTKGRDTDWPGYYAWTDRWLDYPTTWAVIPDEIDAGSQQQDALLREWPHGDRGAPVWHMDEPIDRLVRLTEAWPKVCIGSTGEYWEVLSEPWQARMDNAWNAIAKAHTRTPWIHMLRGLQVVGMRWPFGSGDSTNAAQNHHRPQNTPSKLVSRIDRVQGVGRWRERPIHDQFVLIR